MALMARIRQVGVQSAAAMDIHDLKAPAHSKTGQALGPHRIQEVVLHPVPFVLASFASNVICWTPSSSPQPPYQPLGWSYWYTVFEMTL